MMRNCQNGSLPAALLFTHRASEIGQPPLGVGCPRGALTCLSQSTCSCSGSITQCLHFGCLVFSTASRRFNARHGNCYCVLHPSLSWRVRSAKQNRLGGNPMVRWSMALLVGLFAVALITPNSALAAKDGTSFGPELPGENVCVRYPYRQPCFCHVHLFRRPLEWLILLSTG